MLLQLSHVFPFCSPPPSTPPTSIVNPHMCPPRPWVLPGMESGNRLTAVRGDGEVGTDRKKVKGLVKGCKHFNALNKYYRAALQEHCVGLHRW